ncbi:MAG: TetR/AcrR family transcriptional regulator [Lachnospiraceae bacterium]|nr:TetR/AcrR family transcriptional regulator [Lachnospiraceae bacterium]
MEEKTDRRVRKTKKQLRQGLAKLMEKKSINEITVKELVDEVDINRSTFYLHYTDIFDMLAKIEDELMDEIMDIITPITPFTEDNSSAMDKAYSYLSKLFTMLNNNADICKALCGPHGDMAFINRIEEYIADHTAQYTAHLFPTDLESDLKYIHSYCITGCVGMVKKWILGSYTDTAEHMARLTYDILISSLNSFLTES